MSTMISNFCCSVILWICDCLSGIWFLHQTTVDVCTEFVQFPLNLCEPSTSKKHLGKHFHFLGESLLCLFFNFSKGFIFLCSYSKRRKSHSIHSFPLLIVQTCIPFFSYLKTQCSHSILSNSHLNTVIRCFCL